jgi:hypothetical protein
MVYKRLPAWHRISRTTAWMPYDAKQTVWAPREEDAIIGLKMRSWRHITHTTAHMPYDVNVRYGNSVHGVQVAV